MRADPIEADDRQRGWMRTLLYPVALVQTFHPCSWLDVHTYLCECEVFHHDMVSPRHRWLRERGISCHVSYDTHEVGLEQYAPRIYKLHIEFKGSPEAAAYVEAWGHCASGETTTL